MVSIGQDTTMNCRREAVNDNAAELEHTAGFRVTARR